MTNETILRASEASGYSVETILGRDRHLPICKVRFAIMAALRRNGDKLEYIACVLNRHFDTVRYGLREAEMWSRRDPQFREFMERIA
ncbi:hypothetical protein [Sphingobium sp. CFD-1]|uniref:hypothetical protein n=1 Tax=Sphingobium sp. CFD-1 TaxID=2878545 RepID=UPI00214C12CE|nr:hypothetical protein [Sphingobium sp. CFD-1]